MTGGSATSTKPAIISSGLAITTYIRVHWRMLTHVSVQKAELSDGAAVMRLYNYTVYIFYELQSPMLFIMRHVIVLIMAVCALRLHLATCDYHTVFAEQCKTTICIMLVKQHKQCNFIN